MIKNLSLAVLCALAPLNSSYTKNTISVSYDKNSNKEHVSVRYPNDNQMEIFSISSRNRIKYYKDTSYTYSDETGRYTIYTYEQTYENLIGSSWYPAVYNKISYIQIETNITTLLNLDYTTAYIELYNHTIEETYAIYETDKIPATEPNLKNTNGIVDFMESQIEKMTLLQKEENECEEIEYNQPGWTSGHYQIERASKKTLVIYEQCYVRNYNVEETSSHIRARDDIYFNVVSEETTINIEVVDIWGLILNILTIPFTFVSQAFNLTIFPGTAYSINVSNILLLIIAVMAFIFIIRKFMK